MLKKLTPVIFSLLALAISPSAFGREETISLNGTKLTVNGIPESWNKSGSQNDGKNLRAKAFGNAKLIGIPYIEIVLSEIPNSIQNTDLVERKASILKGICVNGFKAKYLTQKNFAGADTAGLMKCESRVAAKNIPYIEVYFIKSSPTNRVGQISLSLAQEGVSLMQLEAEMARLISDLSITITDSN